MAYQAIMTVTIEEALEIVLALAKQSADPSNERQKEAIATVEDMAVNQFGDD